MADQRQPLLEGSAPGDVAGADVEQSGGDYSTQHALEVARTVHLELVVQDPRTVTRIIRRIEALTIELLAIEVDHDDITAPTSNIVTKRVVDAYEMIAGSSFKSCVPFALLEARRFFVRQGYKDPADADEHMCRALACEAIARRLIARLPLRDQYRVLSHRFTYLDPNDDDDETLPLSALESATDQRCAFFLSSSECQRAVFALWKGSLVTTTAHVHTFDRRTGQCRSVPRVCYTIAPLGKGFMDSFDPARLSVPRYQFIFRWVLWIVFIIAYSFAVQTPDRSFGLEDFVLYVQLFGYMLEDCTRVWKIYSVHAVGFWTIINICIYILAITAFILRLMDIATHDPDLSREYRIFSFQFLSSASPLVWVKLLPVFDVIPFFGSLQICCQRMFRESAIFLVLFALLAVGFLQALTGLDIADSSREQTEEVVHSLVQGLLGSPTFENYQRGTSSYPFGMVLYYAYTGLTLLILLNILIALYGTAYSDATEDSSSSFLVFFATKTIASIRAPDEFVYVAPTNLLEALVVPLEFVLSHDTYAKLNRIIMRIVFCVPLAVIAIYESHLDTDRLEEFHSLVHDGDEFTSSDITDPKTPRMDENGPGEADGKEIAEVPFATLREHLPDLQYSQIGEVLHQVLAVANKVEKLQETVNELSSKQK